MDRVLKDVLSQFKYGAGGVGGLAEVSKYAVCLKQAAPQYHYCVRPFRNRSELSSLRDYPFRQGHFAGDFGYMSVALGHLGITFGV